MDMHIIVNGFTECPQYTYVQSSTFINALTLFMQYLHEKARYTHSHKELSLVNMTCEKRQKNYYQALEYNYTCL